MGREGDKKGISICIAVLPISNKLLARKNYTEFGEKKTIKIFGIEYTSYHAEARVILSIVKNKKWLSEIQKANILELTVLRYTINGNLAKNSEPCENCRKLFYIFKEKFLPRGKIIVNYHKDGILINEEI